MPPSWNIIGWNENDVFLLVNIIYYCLLSKILIEAELSLITIANIYSIVRELWRYLRRFVMPFNVILMESEESRLEEGGGVSSDIKRRKENALRLF